MAKPNPTRKQLTAARNYIKQLLDPSDPLPCIECGVETQGRFGVTEKKKGPPPKDRRTQEKNIPVCFTCYKTGIAEAIMKKLNLME